MSVVFGAAVGGVLAVVVQACGPTPLGAVVRGLLIQPMHAGQSTAVTGIQTDLHSLQSLPFPHATTLSTPADDQQTARLCLSTSGPSASTGKAFCEPLVDVR